MSEISSPASRKQGIGLVSRFACLLLGLAFLCGSPLFATSVIPISDAELYQRADVIVHGVVLSSDVTVDALGRPETLTVIGPLFVLKGRLSGSLVLHQLGGTLPDGRFFKLWGRPEYAPGREVVVFAIARPEGEYQTAEMLLGKFEVWQDETGNLFAVPDLAAGVHSGVEILEKRQALGLAREEDSSAAADGGTLTGKATQDEKRPRELASFLASLRTGLFEASPSVTPSGSLEPVHHAQERSGRVTPQWGNIADSLFRWNNNATATWTISGTANMDGGGIAEAQAALASWTNNPNSTINYVPGSGTSNVLYVNATSSVLGCGWTTCLTGGGVIGCGGPTGVGGSNTWRGQTYTNISQGVAEIRASCAYNGFGSTLTQDVLTHELGHTLGLGHSDQNVSTHDVCRGDENAATMRAAVQNRTTLGTDDQDAIRWLYGDGGNSCAPTTGPSISSVSPATGLTIGGTTVTITGINFVAGATVTIGGSPAVSVTLVGGSTLYATTSAHAAGSVNVVVTNPGPLVATATNGFTYVARSATKSDLDSNGTTDLVWRNRLTGQNSIWLMNGTTPSSVSGLTAVTDTTWKIVGAGDFNLDGNTDLIWRNEVNGLNGIWLMNGTAVSSVASLTTVSDTNWKIVGVGDFNGDGKPDLVWRNEVSGLAGVWLMNGTAVSSVAGLTTVSDTNWKIAGVGDFNGDGKPDLVWRNEVNGSNGVWLMNGTAVSSVAGLPAVCDTNWQLAAVGDFNGDGASDLVWRNGTSGVNTVWLMNGLSVTAIAGLPTLSDVNWRVGAPH